MAAAVTGVVHGLSLATGAAVWTARCGGAGGAAGGADGAFVTPVRGVAGRLSALGGSTTVIRFCTARLYGRAERLAAENGGFGPGSP